MASGPARWNCRGSPAGRRLLPCLTALGVALWRKSISLGLVCGILCGAFILNFTLSEGIFPPLVCVDRHLRLGGARAAGGWLQRPSAAGIVVLCLGGMFGVIQRSGNPIAPRTLAAGTQVRPQRSQLTLLGAGILLSFDDLLHCLLLGRMLRTFTDRQRVSREKLAFLLNRPRRR